MVNVIWWCIPQLRDLDVEILRDIGRYITPDWWPGRGSRRTPLAEARPPSSLGLWRSPSQERERRRREAQRRRQERMASLTAG